MTNKQAYAGLLERLGAIRGYRVCNCRVDEPINPDGPEAAEAISSLLKALTQIEGALELATALKKTVHLARAYSYATGSIFENAMTDADRLADRTIAALNSDAPLSIGEGDRG